MRADIAPALGRARAELYAGLISDACDALGLRTRCLPPGLLPIQEGAVVCGVARTVQVAPATGIPDSPYAKQIEFSDSLRADDVVVAAAAPQARTAFWGELFSTAAQARGAAGAVIDGYVRDVARLRQMDFPVFARGTHPADSMGRLTVSDYDVPIRIDDVTVAAGDLIFADVDGAVCVPADAAAQVLERAFAKRSTESVVRAELRAGSTLRAAYDRHRVL